MATQLNIKNFKSLVDVDITIKPITLLFGPNNNGKSSLLNSLFFLSENISKVHTTNFKLGNKNLSSYKEVVSFNDEQKDIIFELKTIVDAEIFEKSREKALYELRRVWDEDKNKITKLIELEENIVNRLNGKGIKANIIFSNNVDDKMLSRKLKRTDIFIDDKKVLSVNFDKVYFIEDEEGHVSAVLDLYSNKGGIKLYFHKNVEIEKLLSERLEKHFQEIINTNISKLERADNSIAEPLLLGKTNVVFVNAFLRRLLHLYEYNNYLEYFRREDKFELSNEFTEDIFNQFTEIVYLFSHLMTSQWGISLPNFNEYLGPLRERPKHKYLINGDVDYSRDFYFEHIVGLEYGDEIADAIENAEEILPFFFEDASLTLKKDEDIGRLFFKQRNAMFNLAEASSGLLQLLPILIKKPKVIEQPELHLHPKLQAKFADLFVYWLTEKKKEVIVETHSEHLLRRLQVLVAKGQVSSDDVVVYYFDKKDGETKIIKMEMEENGLFKNNWPEGFFDDKANLTFALMEAIKNRN